MDYTIKRLSEVINITGLSKTTIYRMINAGEFPQSINLTARSVGWRSNDVQDWLASRTENAPVHRSINN